MKHLTPPQPPEKSAKTRQIGAWRNPQARAARLELQEKYGRDVLETRPPQWQNSAYVNNHKSTHQPLANQPADFTRGLVTTGWNFSTTPGCSTLQNHTEISHITSTDQHKYKIKDYCSPVESAATNAATRRAAKQLPALQIQMWQHKYGKEGAAAMQQMQSQKPADPRKTFKVTKFDVEAVAALDKNLPFMDSQMAHLVSCPLPSERSLISSNTASSGTTLHAVETPTATVTTHADTTSPSASAVMSGAADTPTVDMTTASGSTTSISNHSLVVVA